MTVQKRLEILRRHAPEVKWFFDEKVMRFVGIMGKNGVRCLIGKDAGIPDVMRLALSVQTELRGTKNGKKAR